MQGVWRLMSECWYEKPGARVSILRVRKSINNLMKSLEEHQPEKISTPHREVISLDVPS